jgi:uncharacterized protein (DUF2236 family)
MDAYFDDSSMLRRVHRETAVAVSGPRALFMQAAHPVLFEGFFAHTAALDEPYERLRRTAQVMDTIAFGSRTDADRATRRVRGIHRRVRGELTQPAGRFPAGTRFAADDPVLLLWVLATLVDSALVVYEHCVRSLSTTEREAYWQDYRIIGRLFGLEDDDMPLDIHGFDDYMRQTLAGPDLHVTATARELARRVVLHPPVPLAHRPVLKLVNFITVGLLPARLRDQYGLGWNPVWSLMLRGGAAYARHVLIPVAPERLRFVASARDGSSPLRGMRAQRAANRASHISQPKNRR